MNRSLFCDKSPLWDVNLTWYTDDPDFTTCFHQTVLTYIPIAVLLLLAPLSIWSSSKSKDRGIPWTALSVTKMILHFVLVILSTIDLGYAIDHE